MVIQPIYNFKYFSVGCLKCKLEETMVFRCVIRGNNINNNLKPKVPYFYEFESMTSIDRRGEEIVNIFIPIHGMFGDKLPEHCPICGTGLVTKTILVQY